MRRLHSCGNQFVRRGAAAAAAVLALAMALGLAGPARAQRFPLDPVEALRQTLRQGHDLSSPEILREYERALEEWARAIRSPGDLARALILEGWGLDYELEPKREDIDQKVWTSLADRFVRDMREALKPGGEPLRARAAATLLSEMAAATQVPGAGGPRLQERLADLAPDLARLTGETSEPLAVRAAALLALGKVAPRAREGMAAVERVLRNGQVASRRAAAEALVELVRVPTQAPEPTAAPKPGPGKGKPESRVDISERVVPVAAIGLDDSDSEVRRLCLSAIHEAARGLRDVFTPPVPTPGAVLTPEEQLIPHGGANVGSFRGLIDALSAVAPRVARLTQSSNADVRVLALRTLEEMGFARQHMGQPQPPPGPPKKPMQEKPMSAAAPGGTPVVAVTLAAAEGPRDPLLHGLERALSEVAAAVSDPDVRVRLAAIDTLEMLGPDALPAAPALIRALADVDPFVRWAAARTLGKMVPPGARRVNPVLVEAVPGLARLLADPDLDVRLAAAQALTNFGPDAAGAVDALAQAVGCGDVEARVAAVGALEAIGDQAAPAIPAVIQALGQEDPRLLSAACRLLGRFGAEAAAHKLPEMKAQVEQAVPALRALLNSGDAGVRRDASDALLNILGP